MTLLVLGLAALAVLLVYWFPLRKWWGRWGATDEDLARVMLGDVEVTDPAYSATLAVTIEALPRHIWPWLLQMGYRRGGLYSYDWLDRLFGYLDAPSAETILPEYQHLDVGDEIPLGRGSPFPVTSIEPLQALVLAGRGDGFAWVWQFGLYPLGQGRTRVLSRNAARIPRTIGAWLLMRMMEPAAFLMTRRMLLGLKHRAERLAADSSVRSTHAA